MTLTGGLKNMSRAQTVDLINRMFVQMSKHDIDACVAFYTKDAELQDPTFPDPVRGDDRVRAGFTDWMQAFPDVHAWVVDIILDGHKPALECSFQRTHSRI